jgi:hypothetical protein
MTLTEQIFAHALVLAGELEPRQEALLKVLCRSAENALSMRLRQGLTPEDCKADFISAAGLYALSAMSGMDEMDRLEQITAGDITLKRAGGDVASNCLRHQAELMITPYLKDRFVFRGV